MQLKENSQNPNNPTERKEYKNFVCLGIVVNNQGEILLIKRAKEEIGEGGRKLTWAFPGGKLLEGESREHCVEREVELETGIKIVPEKQIALRRHPEFPVVIAYYFCKPVDNNLTPQTHEPDEVAEIKWVKPEEIKNLFTTPLNPDVAKFLQIN